ncbi:trimeric intracellular cation channel family protein [Tunicatimonas pelagia]|uniref:trimeric intracellular cation channel family protein n=1 Tax=Tunicatimonas pelagia TaxID=931531 RepID=UPI0026671334|nr:trimeric intracellular cation channel family protein [Tunicatimonas pelagia]WKN44194.1 trimeric intracellular cation channel family protein [Tunicatimonas pelagia]
MVDYMDSYITTFFYAIDLSGTFVFAISGTLTAYRRQIDLFGAGVIALVTALGGGTIRDILIGSLPVGWMQDLRYLLVVASGLTTALVFRGFILKLSKTMFLFDTLGIGLFTVLGLQKTLDLGLHPLIAVMMGTVSAVFGGLVRDLLTNEVPLVLRKEIYATACLLGGVLFLCLRFFEVPSQVSTIITILFISGIRILAVWRGWHLPVAEEFKKKLLKITK